MSIGGHGFHLFVSRLNYNWIMIYTRSSFSIFKSKYVIPLLSVIYFTDLQIQLNDILCFFSIIFCFICISSQNTKNSILRQREIYFLFAVEAPCPMGVFAYFYLWHPHSVFHKELFTLLWFPLWPLDCTDHPPVPCFSCIISFKTTCFCQHFYLKGGKLGILLIY